MNKEKIANQKGYYVSKTGEVFNRHNIELNYNTIPKNGYKRIFICHEGKKIQINVHRLQAYQKYGDKIFNKGIVVRHFDGNKLNNSWDNILIGTSSDNMMDIPEQIRIKKAKYASSFMTKYNHTEVVKFYNSCKSYKKTMEKFNISSKGTLNYILKSSCVVSNV